MVKTIDGIMAEVVEITPIIRIFGMLALLLFQGRIKHPHVYTNEGNIAAPPTLANNLAAMHANMISYFANNQNQGEKMEIPGLTEILTQKIFPIDLLSGRR